MSRSAMPQDDRLRELLAERALGGLTAEESRELATVEDAQRAELEFAEAIVAVEYATGSIEDAELPASVRRRLELAAEAFVQGSQVTATPSRVESSPERSQLRVAGTPASASPVSGSWARRSPWFAAGGWIAAAACLAILVFSAVLNQPSGVPEPDSVAQQGTPTGGPESVPLASQRRALIATASDTQVFEWHPWVLEGEGPEVREVTGDVVWSESQQQGYMRFRGLPENDPDEVQYQLWIVDSRGLFDETGQSARISGGVFDASRAARDPQTGDLIVPINAKLTVQGAAAFAITIERPGGTWVSDMSRRVVWTIPG
ncbi:MAG: hypothetical protein EA378_05065 [Phycisphaerales bacterium]|nr:MAG: hypothetical protein EA378_05065 [Phycisphaerales bacterium]